MSLVVDLMKLEVNIFKLDSTHKKASHEACQEGC
jgi:hypothetical protein